VNAEWEVCGLGCGIGWCSGDDVGAVPRLKVFVETVRGMRWVVLAMMVVVVVTADSDEAEGEADLDGSSPP
jgi:hypothetical protein